MYNVYIVLTLYTQYTGIKYCIYKYTYNAYAHTVYNTVYYINTVLLK